jgi:hypothetical protein
MRQPRRFGVGLEGGTVKAPAGTHGQKFVVRPQNMRHPSGEVSSQHDNFAGGFFSLHPALLVTWAGEVRLRSFKYRALP